MSHELKFFLLRLGTLLVLTPILGFCLMRFLEYFVQVWQSKKKCVSRIYSYHPSH